MASKKKPAFGGYSINFGEVEDTTLGEVFGTDDMPPSEMTKKIWAFVKENELSNKPVKTFANLQEYWDDTEYDDMDLDKVEEILETMKATDKAHKLVKAIFKKQTKKPDEFEKEIDNFVNDSMTDLKEKSKSKKKNK